MGSGVSERERGKRKAQRSANRALRRISLAQRQRPRVAPADEHGDGAVTGESEARAKRVRCRTSVPARVSWSYESSSGPPQKAGPTKTNKTARRQRKN